MARADYSRFPSSATGFLLPPVAWAVFFVLIYSIQGAVCGAGLGEATLLGLNGLTLALAAVTALTALLIVAVGVWSYRVRRGSEATAQRHDDARLGRFLATATALNAGLFFIATLWIGIPLALAPPCGGP